MNQECTENVDILDAKELAEKHWEYTRKVVEFALAAGGCYEQEIVDLCGYLYRESFVHGWKHCEEELDT